MGYHLTPYTAPIVASGVVSLALGGYAWLRWYDRRDDLALLFFVLLMVSAAVWAFTDAIQISATTRPTKLAVLRLSNVATAVAPTAWFLFALHYVDRSEALSRRGYSLLAVEPILIVLATIANPWTGLLWRNARVVFVEGFPTLDRALGPLFVVHAVYSYAFVIAGAYVILRAVRRWENGYQLQGVALAVGAVLPVLANVVFLLSSTGAFVVGPRTVNLTSSALAGSGLLFSVAIFRFRLLDLAPVARETVVEGMRDGYVVVDDEGDVVDYNPAAERFLSVDDPIGVDVATAFPDVADAVEPLDASASDGFDAASREVPVETPDGTRIVEIDVDPVPSTTGARVLLLRDVTARREVERRYRAIVENSTDVVSILDTDGTIRYESPAIERQLGWDPDELEGESAFDYVHPDDREHVVTEFANGTADPGDSATIEYRFRAADGSYRVLESRAKNLLDDPLIEGVVVVSRDVSERKRREEQLRETNERLNQFANVVSHDLRNPLNVAEGHLDLVREGNEASIDEIEASLDRMRRIVDDVLTLARGGDRELSTEPLAVADVARSAWSNVATGDATLTVTAEGRIVGDRSRVLQLFENLFRNSVEHGGPDVAVTVGDATDGEGFFVADDGDGVPEEHRDHLFEMGVTTSGEGTGFGLAIVSQVVDEHGWSIELADADGGGATFVVTGVARPESGIDARE